MSKTIRKKPRHHETISIGGSTKWRLDALCVAGRRSRTATVGLLLDFYLKHNVPLRDFVAERMNDPHPIQLKKPRASDAFTGSTTTDETTNPAAALARSAE
jgi:hypothetical protein